MDDDQKYLEMAMRFASVIGKTLHVYAEYREGQRCYVFASEGSSLHKEAESNRLTCLATY
jgi:hypothetical protein